MTRTLGDIAVTRHWIAAWERQRNLEGPENGQSAYVHYAADYLVPPVGFEPTSLDL